ncbi:hypothetical protein H4R19_006334, partial [Coemansia spiralis]
MDLESTYWEQYCADGLGEGFLPPQQPAADGYSVSSRDSYWSRYSCTRGSTRDLSTPDQPQPQPQQAQRRRWRLLVVPDRLAALRLEDSDASSATQAVEAMGKTPESTAEAAADTAGASDAGACDPPEIRSDSAGQCDEAVVPPGSPSSPGSWGVNPAALEMRLNFLKQEMDQNDRLQLDATAP